MIWLLVVLLALGGLWWGIRRLLSGDVVGALIAEHMKATGRDPDGDD